MITWHVPTMGQRLSQFATLASKMTTSSAMNPGLVFCCIVVPIGLLGGISFFHVGLPIPGAIFTLIGCYPIAIVGWQLIHFTNKEPDRLQREQHVEKMQEMRHALAVKDHGQITEIAITGDLTGNPQLEDRSGE